VAVGTFCVTLQSFDDAAPSTAMEAPGALSLDHVRLITQLLMDAGPHLRAALQLLHPLSQHHAAAAEAHTALLSTILAGLQQRGGGDTAQYRAVLNDIETALQCIHADFQLVPPDSAAGTAAALPGEYQAAYVADVSSACADAVTRLRR
jgi:hypothetical protein